MAEENAMDVCVIGLGYIGLPTAALLATRGYSVLGVDVNPDVVASVNQGVVPFVEPDLGVVVAGAVSRKKLRAAGAIEPASTFIVAVPTPFASDWKPDLQHVREAADSIASVARGGELVVLESTSPPGTTARLAEWIFESRPDLARESGRDNSLYFAHCPERVLPGRIMIELVANDRIIGGLTEEGAVRARELYESFCQGQILMTDAVTAEVSKLVENAYRDVNIAFANEIANIAETVGFNPWEVIELANHHPRVNILQPGPGVGGHCIAVDPWFIIDSAPGSAELMRTARAVNDARPARVVEKLCALADSRPGEPVALLGLSYKADIDDHRQSPAVEIVSRFADARPGIRTLVVDSHFDELPVALRGRENVRLEALQSALRSASIIALLVNHSEFRTVSASDLVGKQVLDTRAAWRDIWG